MESSRIRLVALAALTCATTAGLLASHSPELLRARNVALVRNSCLTDFSRATPGEMADSFSPEQHWTVEQSNHGSWVAVVEWSFPVRMSVGIDGKKNTPTSVSLDINRVPQTEKTTRDFLENLYSTIYPDSERIVGSWLNQDGATRIVHFEADKTFWLFIWPWAFSGTYACNHQGRELSLVPARPLYGGVDELSFTYVFSGDNNLVLVDRDADILLRSTPVVFQRRTLLPGERGLLEQ